MSFRVLALLTREILAGEARGAEHLAKRGNSGILYSRLRSSPVSFVSGVLLAASVNLLTALITVDVLPKGWLSLVVASALFLTSAILFFSVSPTLDDVHEQWRLAGRRPEAWPVIVEENLRFLNTFVISAVILALVGFGVLAVDLLDR